VTGVLAQPAKKVDGACRREKQSQPGIAGARSPEHAGFLIFWTLRLPAADYIYDRILHER
jgi:hypothetical protein